jgi:hypothetical protein
VLTGDAKTSAENAALAAVPGGTVTRSSTEDSSFTVLSTNADTHQGPPAGQGGDQRGGPRA